MAGLLLIHLECLDCSPKSSQGDLGCQLCSWEIMKSTRLRSHCMMLKLWIFIRVTHNFDWTPFSSQTDLGCAAVKAKTPVQSILCTALNRPFVILPWTLNEMYLDDNHWRLQRDSVKMSNFKVTALKILSGRNCVKTRVGLFRNACFYVPCPQVSL